MPYHVFHQNMRTFGGGSANRNDAYEDALWDVSNTLGAHRVVAAGWTEITNAGTSLAPLRSLARTLDPALTRTSLFNCGVTALGGQEYIGISVYSTFVVQGKGRVMYNSVWKRWDCLSQADCAVDTFPSGYSADYRGVCYVYGTLAGQQLVFGFMHNLYTLGERTLPVQALPTMALKIQQKHGLNAGVTDWVFGGDFNADPSDREGLHVAAAVDGMGNLINTTVSNCYDYWFTASNVASANAQVHTDTRGVGAGLSDHAGVTLRLPYL